MTAPGGVSCATCPCRLAVGEDGRTRGCPFVDRRRAAGEYLYLAGAPGDHVYFVKRGTIVLCREAPGGRGERVVGVRGPGSFLGLEILVGPAYLETARVATAATICVGDRSTLDSWLGPPNTPARVALEGVLGASRAAAMPGSALEGSSLARVAGWLLASQDGSPEATIARQDLAALLGMRPETLSRTIAELVRRGAIESDRRSVRVLDREVLVSVLAPGPGEDDDVVEVVDTAPRRLTVIK